MRRILGILMAALVLATAVPVAEAASNRPKHAKAKRYKVHKAKKMSKAKWGAKHRRY